MSSDFYFSTWLQTMRRLEIHLKLDLEYQASKVHDQRQCDAVQRLTGVLGEYCAIYNDAIECYTQNLQVQKTAYIADVIRAIVARIIELKHQISKLSCSNHQFFGVGLVNHKITTYDVEMIQMLQEFERSQDVVHMIEEAFNRAEEKKKEIERLAKEEEQREEEEKECEDVNNWWDTEANEEQEKHEKLDVTNVYYVEEKLDEKTLKEKNMIAMIQAHERTRQVTRLINQKQNRRWMWTKELEGTLNPQPRLDIKHDAAKLIQQVCRKYFELKRKKIQDCKRDELLGLRQCDKPKLENVEKLQKNLESRNHRYRKYDKELNDVSQDIKEQLVKKKGEEIAEDFRDYIREWFTKWFKDINMFYDIPQATKGGSVNIFQELVPEPREWLEDYKVRLNEQMANKGKNALQLKYEKQAAKELMASAKKDDRAKQRKEEIMARKLKKNPNLHPGYHFPQSMKTELISKVIDKYHNDWDNLDKYKTVDVKEKFVETVTKDKVCMEVKLQVLPAVDDHMREELKTLKRALKRDYLRNGEKFPDVMKTRKARQKKNKKLRKTEVGNTLPKLEYLVEMKILVQYPRKSFKDFIGDHNYAGDDFSCLYKSSLAFAGEIRGLVWEKAQEVMVGFKKILIVGPMGSGKTMLVHAIASANDATLFEINLDQLTVDPPSPQSLNNLITSLATCAKVAQPSVIYVRDVQRLFYRKTPKEETKLNLPLIKRYIIRKLFKKITKKDKVTVVASCINPWETKSKMLLKIFTEVLLVANTNYTTVVKLLKDWVLRNHTIPRDLNIHSLAYMLQGYRFGHLETTLENFLTPERLVKIAAFGLLPEEIYDFIVDNSQDNDTDYERYLSWYTDKTSWGIKEKKHREDQLEFKAAVERFEEKMKKKKKKIANID